VISVGGTSLYKDKTNPRGWREEGWRGAGAGCSGLAANVKPIWQTDSGCDRRAVADVSAVGDSLTGVSIYFTFEGVGGWEVVGGTSAAGPIIAALEALKPASFREAKAKAFYDAAEKGELYDVLDGANKNCFSNPGSYLCEATAGYDGPTGVGTPGAPLPGPPAAPKGVTLLEPEEATLNADIDPQNSATTYQFEYGTTSAYGSSVPATPAAIGGGSEPVSVSQRLTGLKSNATYHWRVSATNSTGTFQSEDRNFTTPTAPAIATASSPATSVTQQGATLNGAIRSTAPGVTYQFEYGTTDSYGSAAPAQAKEVANGYSVVSQALGELKAGRSYRFRLKATQGATTTYSRQRTFLTQPGAPTAIVKPATSIFDNSATMNGIVSGGGRSDTTYRFELVSDEDFRAGGYAKAAKFESQKVLFSRDDFVVQQSTFSQLQPDTTYHHRLIAENGTGTSTSADETFTTSGWSLGTLQSQGSLASVSCSAAGVCTAVGTSTSSSPAKTLAVRLKVTPFASSWPAQTTPNPAGSSESRLEGASCPTATSCTAVGYNVASGVGQPLVESWNGSEWTIQALTLPSGAQGGRLEGVSCTSASACTAVGYYVNAGGTNVPLVERWNGSEWTTQSAVAPGGSTRATLHEVSCASSTDCWAVGESENASKEVSALAEHWNGSSWSLGSLPGSLSTLTSVSCSSASWCAAVGTGRHVEHWNGSSWSDRVAPAPNGVEAASLKGVSCVSATNCTAVGSYPVQKHATTLVEHWGGSAWEVRPTPDFALEPESSFSEVLESVSCTPGYCAAAGWGEGNSKVKFTTTRVRSSKPPHAYTNPASGLAPGTATLNAEVNPMGEDTSYRFEYDTAPYGKAEAPHGNATTLKAIGSQHGEVQVSQAIGGLAPNTAYHYRVVSESPTGISYGEDRALELHGPRFEAASYPAALSGSQAPAAKLTLNTEGGKVSCNKATLAGEMSAAATSLALVPSFSECEAFGFTEATVNANGCAFVPRLGATVWGSRYPGTMDVECPAGKAIEVSSFNCALTIPAQSGLGGVVAEGSSATTPPQLALTAAISKIKYTKTKDGTFCPFTGTGTKEDGVLAGVATVSATSGGTPEQLGIAGLELGAPSGQLEAEFHPANVSGAPITGKAPSMTFEGGLTASCEKASVSGELSKAATEISLMPSFAECTAFGFTEASIAMNGCGFLLHTDAGAGASADISCPSGKAIELSSFTCKISIPAQSARKMVTLSNESGVPASLALSLALGKVTYTKTKDGTFCPLSGTGTKEDGQIGVDMLLTARNVSEAPNGLRVRLP
jgi:hypothetical protein